MIYLVIWIAPTEQIRVLAFQLQSKFAWHDWELELSQTFWRTTWSFIVLINDSKHLCAQHAAMNMWLKLDLHQLQLYCAENGFETFRDKSVEICLTATFYHLTA